MTSVGARLRLGLVSATVVVAALIAGACSAATSPGAGTSGDPAGAGSRLQVLATTTVFADMVANVGGSLVQVTSLVPRNSDVHTFSPKPSALAAVARARVIVMNGLGLDDWLDRIIQNASQGGARIVKLADGLPGVTLLPGDTPDTQNPHLWLDVQYAELYVDRIETALSEADPNHAAAYASQAAAYKVRLAALDAWVRDQVATVPAANRRIVTFHDAFPYFARAYGIEVVGVAVEAPGQDPSAGDTAKLIDAIRAANVRAIFSEKQFPPKLVDALAAETGATVVSTLYDDALGDPPIDSYEAVIRWDVQQLVEALR